MPKLTSTNVNITANDKMGLAKLGQNDREPCFIEEQHLEELRDLINDYLELKKKGEV